MGRCVERTHHVIALAAAEASTTMSVLTVVGAAVAAILGTAGVLALVWKVAKPHAVNLIHEVTATRQQLDPEGEESTRQLLTTLTHDVRDVSHRQELLGAEVTGIKEGLHWAGRMLDHLLERDRPE